MSNDKKIYKVYIKSTKEFLEVDKDFYYAYYRPIWSTRKKMQRTGECVCPKSKAACCDGDCCLCEYYLPYSISLESSIVDDDIPLIESIPANKDISSDYKFIEEINEIILSLPEKYRILCECLKEGCKNEEIRNAINYQGDIESFKKYKHKMMQKLKDVFKDFNPNA